ncbi:class I SAM-dependent rRNA methyltransferase [Thermosulfuriphilus sp.]
MEEVRLNRQGLRRILSGHLWLREDDLEESQKGLPGGWVIILTPRREPVATGYFDPHGRILLRVVALEVIKPDKDFFKRRLKRALCLRRKLFPEEEVFRLVFSEADGLPGLIVDRYEELLVIQVTTLGMAHFLEEIVSALEDLFPQAAIFLSPGEGLKGQLDKDFLKGRLTFPYWVRINNLFLPVDPLLGQKTGLFLDQRQNQQAWSHLFSGKKVLDLFCYLGSWGLVAAYYGAREVLGVDRSGWAISQATTAAQKNNLTRRIRFLQEDVRSFLSPLSGAYDLIILDPPALIKKKRHFAAGRKNYLQLNRLAIKALKKDGLLISCSCSHHLSLADHQRLVHEAAWSLGRQAILLEARGQGADHPVLLSIPETAYLSCLLVRV